MIKIYFQFDETADGANIFNTLRQSVRETRGYSGKPNSIKMIEEFESALKDCEDFNSEDGQKLWKKFKAYYTSAEKSLDPVYHCIDIQHSGPHTITLEIGSPCSNPDDEVSFTIAQLPEGALTPMEDEAVKPDENTLDLPLEDTPEDNEHKPELTQVDKSANQGKPVTSANPLNETLDQFIESKKGLYDAISALLSKMEDDGKTKVISLDTYSRKVMEYIHTLKCVIAAYPTSPEDSKNFMFEAQGLYNELQPVIDKVFRSMKVSDELKDVHSCVQNRIDYKPAPKDNITVEDTEPVDDKPEPGENVYNLDSGEISQVKND